MLAVCHKQCHYCAASRMSEMTWCATRCLSTRRFKIAHCDTNGSPGSFQYIAAGVGLPTLVRTEKSKRRSRQVDLTSAQKRELVESILKAHNLQIVHSAGQTTPVKAGGRSAHLKKLKASKTSPPQVPEDSPNQPDEIAPLAHRRARRIPHKALPQSRTGAILACHAVVQPCNAWAPCRGHALSGGCA